MMLEESYRTLLAKINEGYKCVMLTYLDLQDERSGSVGEKVLLTLDELENKSIPLQDEIYEKINLSLGTGRIEKINTEQSKAILIEPFIPNPRLIIFGGGHIAKPLSEFASRIGFSVTLIDDRPFFASSTRFPEAERVICESFEKSFSKINLRKSDYVVIITRGHRHDGLVLREVLNYDLSYIGMIGSRRRVKGMKEELIKEGYCKDKLDSVNAPIGLDIGAISPEEIAISILAQLISYKNKGNPNKPGESFTMPDFDREVAEVMSEKSAMSRALITILSSKGSVPRKAGAKMVAFLDGRTIGSIGGGCSEAEVITKARGILSSKGFLIEHVDMTGEVAESEGMVCGGVMEVLIEAL